MMNKIRWKKEKERGEKFKTKQNKKKKINKNKTDQPWKVTKNTKREKTIYLKTDV